ncbi:hypothetical protein ZPR_3600 [Zunongwangia profunda SM-A87]|uniref:Uncharacterized protein n=1 Tax=Zunongwangia profunda (strain DSM 18752 / CCTCC AB 206139 / SM-A87) TaxID=655815 RepID=D5BKK3_ZUNPS|nr:hypothetical protein ZPR_3600 [Zunongwangia profunda SM-A87]
MGTVFFFGCNFQNKKYMGQRILALIYPGAFRRIQHR